MGITTVCSTCGVSVSSNKETRNRRFFCSRKCYDIAQATGSTSSSGYRLVSVGGRQIKGHRLVVEDFLGRRLAPTEHVHHKNGIKTDNRPENLEIISQSNHGRLHHPPTRPLTTDCVICGTTFTPTSVIYTGIFCFCAAFFRQFMFLIRFFSATISSSTGPFQTAHYPGFLPSWVFRDIWQVMPFSSSS